MAQLKGVKMHKVTIKMNGKSWTMWGTLKTPVKVLFNEIWRMIENE